jgi:hypothetical protein
MRIALKCQVERFIGAQCGSAMEHSFDLAPRFKREFRSGGNFLEGGDFEAFFRRYDNFFHAELWPERKAAVRIGQLDQVLIAK